MVKLGRILIADDEETFLHSTADLLRREGYECDAVPDSATATERLRTSDYELLIADIRMPGNSDLELIEELPGIAEGMPVILITGYPSLKSATQSIQLPVVAYLVKPVDFSELLRHVRTSTGSVRLYRALCKTLERLKDWRENLTDIKEVMDSTTARTSSTAVDAFVDLSFRNVIDIVSDLKHLTEALCTDKSDQEVCHLFGCPKLTALKGALMETIDILEKTKNAFKSKDLGHLRKKLEGLVEQGE